MEWNVSAEHQRVILSGEREHIVRVESRDEATREKKSKGTHLRTKQENIRPHHLQNIDLRRGRGE
jgi:hypothetical protein